VNLGIVGHAAEKFTPETARRAKLAIIAALAQYSPKVVVSGRSPMGGIDVWAEDAARACGIKTLIFPPKVVEWDPPGEYGYKARNLDIAKHSDLVVCVVVATLPPAFEGMAFGDCYHCKGRTPPHVKSGGCWTAWKAKARKWIILGEPTT
jgi:hypothetical protein